MKVLFPEAINSLISIRRTPLKRTKLDLVDPLKSLVVQLGRRWEGYAMLSSVRKKTLRQLWVRSKNFSEQESRLLDFFSDQDEAEIKDAVDNLSERHAYENTVILAFIENIKKHSSVIKSSDFQWLRAYDDHMWLMINNFGRPRVSPLIVGAFQHFSYEKSIAARCDDTFFHNATLTIGKTVIALTA